MYASYHIKYGAAPYAAPFLFFFARFGSGCFCSPLPASSASRFGLLSWGRSFPPGPLWTNSHASPLLQRPRFSHRKHLRSAGAAARTSHASCENSHASPA